MASGTETKLLADWVAGIGTTPALVTRDFVWVDPCTVVLHVTGLDRRHVSIPVSMRHLDNLLLIDAELVEALRSGEARGDFADDCDADWPQEEGGDRLDDAKERFAFQLAFASDRTREAAFVSGIDQDELALMGQLGAEHRLIPRHLAEVLRQTCRNISSAPCHTSRAYGLLKMVGAMTPKEFHYLRQGKEQPGYEGNRASPSVRKAARLLMKNGWKLTPPAKGA